MADPGCEYVDVETGDRCGNTPTQPLAIGMTAGTVKPGDVAGYAGTFLYSHYCDEHLPEIQKQLGQK